MEYADADYKCNAYMCRGYQLEDNLDNVQVFSAGDELTVHIDLIAGHRPGYAVGSFAQMLKIRLILKRTFRSSISN